MTDSADEWQSFSDAFARFGRHVDKSKSVNINAKSLRTEARSLAQQYFRKTRPALLKFGIDEQLEALNDAFQIILELSERSNSSSSYKKQIKIVRKLKTKTSSLIELSHGLVKSGKNNTIEDEHLIQTLQGLVPSAALSYKQAVTDLLDDTRISFRGPAVELREVLRETLDHLAPDNDVIHTEGYSQEKGRNGPTMKQKVRFIMKSRGRSKSSSSVSEQTATTVDEMVGSLARSIYDQSSVATHIASERRTVVQIRRYIVAVLHDILEL